MLKMLTRNDAKQGKGGAMSDDQNRLEVVAPPDSHNGKHRFAVGVLTGAAVGVGVALLFAPRTGAQMRHEIGHQWTRARDSCSTGYRRARGAASDWSGRGRHTYDVTRTKVVHGARETRQYVREVADAVTRKAHREAPTAANADFAVISH
jgi:gas vesicle protein